MFANLALQISDMLSAKPDLNSTDISLVQEDQFWKHLKNLKHIGLCYPLITIVTDQGVFARFKLLRPFFEFEIFIQSTTPKILNQKLTLSFRKSSLTSFNESLHQRPILKKLQELSPHVAVHWSSKINPLEGNYIQWALAGLYENVWNLKVPKKALLIRTLVCELQRVLWGLEYLKRISIQLHWNFWKELWLNYRECLFQIQETISGYRLFPNMIVIGGVNKNINIGNQKRIQKYILELSQTLSTDLNQFLQKTEFLKGFLSIDRDDLERITWGGVIAKASHSYWDARLFASYGLEEYTPILLQSRMLPVGDALDRIRSVNDDILHSLKNVMDMIAKLSNMEDKLPLADPVTQDHNINDMRTFVVEGASGPIYAAMIDQKIAISTSSMRASSQLPYLLFDIDDEKIDLALASLGYQECEGCLA